MMRTLGQFNAIGLMNTYNRMAISFRNTPQAALAN
jgi:hypothetical protein